MIYYDDQIRGFNFVPSSWADWEAFADNDDHDYPSSAEKRLLIGKLNPSLGPRSGVR